MSNYHRRVSWLSSLGMIVCALLAGLLHGQEASIPSIYGPGDSPTFGTVTLGGVTLSGSAANKQFILNSTVNSIGAGCTISAITGLGDSGQPNVIGVDEAKPAGTEHTPRGWANDTEYVDGSADVAHIAGGYDHVNNQLGGFIGGGGHNFLFSTGTHGFIGGGSYNFNSGNRAAIVGGLANSISGAETEFGFIGGGQSNEIYEDIDHGFIGGGLDNAARGGNYAAVVNGNDNDASALFALILNGQSNDVTGARSIVLNGTNNLISATDSAALGTGNSVTSGAQQFVVGINNATTHSKTISIGEDVITHASGSITISGGKISEKGDSQIISMHCDGVTTTATGYTTLDPGVTIPAGKAMSGTAKILVIGMRDGSVTPGNNDASYVISTYQTECGFFWDGTNGILHNASTESTGASPSLDLTAIRNNLAVSAAPRLQIDGGSFRIQVKGLNSLRIKWVGRMDIVMVTAPNP